jgi:branched-chain amino acid transport system permease protein
MNTPLKPLAARPSLARLPRWMVMLGAGMALSVPLLLGNRYYLHLAIMWGIYAILTLSLTVVTGTAGLLSFGQAGFFGIGAYASGLIVKHFDVSFLLGAATAVLLSIIVGVLIGIPILRLQGLYLGIATLGFGEVVHYVVRNWEELTGGPLGLSRIPKPELLGLAFDNVYSYYGLVVVFLLLVAWVCYRLQVSQFGLALTAMRDDPIAAELSGVNLATHRITAFAIGAGLAGLAGSLFAHYMTYLNPENFTNQLSTMVITMHMVGGRGNIIGSLLGAGIVHISPELLHAVPRVRLLMYGALLTAVVVGFPDGILGRLRLGGHVLTQLVAKGRNLGLWRAKMIQRLKPALAEAPCGAAPGEVPAPVTANPGLPAPRPAVARAVAGKDNGVDAEVERDLVLRVEDLRVVFGGLAAVDGLSFDLKRGEILGIIGPNGSGKTTVLNALTGMVPSSGRIRFNGREMSRRPSHLRTKDGISRTFQTLRLFPSMNVGETVLVGAHGTMTRPTWEYVARLGPARRAEVNMGDQAKELLELLELSEAAGRQVKQLPYGVQRRIEIARALAAHPEVLVLDEPAAGLSTEEGEELCDVIRTARDLGISVILVEHRMKVVMSVADRIVVINYGRKLAEGVPAEILRNEEVIEAYLGRRKGGVRDAGHQGSSG